MSESDSLTLWGTRGSIPRSEPEFSQYGGATSCVQVGPLLLDAGTGIVSAGDALLAQGQREFHVLLSHVHFDHIMGLPFFQPLWRADCQVTIYVGNLIDQTGHEMLYQLMRAPFFPVDPGYFRAQWQVVDFSAGETLQIAQRRVETLALTHPQGACGYRVRGSEICYITDIEPDQAMGERLVRFVHQARAMIYDCTFGDDDFEPDHGHSTWQACLEFCERAQVTRPIVFHHHPRACDQRMAELETQVHGQAAHAIVARDQMQLELEDLGRCGADGLTGA